MEQGTGRMSSEDANTRNRQGRARKQRVMSPGLTGEDYMIFMRR